MSAPRHNRDSCHRKVLIIHDQVVVVIFEWVFDGEYASERLTVIEAFKFVNDCIQLEGRVTQQQSYPDVESGV